MVLEGSIWLVSSTCHGVVIRLQIGKGSLTFLNNVNYYHVIITVYHITCHQDILKTRSTVVHETPRKKTISNVSTLQIMTSMDQSRQNTFVNQKHITAFGTQNFNFSQTWNIIQVMTQMAQHTFLTK